MAVVTTPVDPRARTPMAGRGTRERIITLLGDVRPLPGNRPARRYALVRGSHPSLWGGTSSRRSPARTASGMGFFCRER